MPQRCNVYVAEQFKHRVVELPAAAGAQRVLPFTGFGRLGGLAVDSAGNLYVIDGNDRVVKLTVR